LEYDFDHNSENHRRGIETTWASMRELEVLPYSRAHNGFYVVTRYEDVAYAARNPEIFSSAQGIAIPDLHVDFRLLPLETDPPVHREYRRLLNPFVTHDHVSRFEPIIREVASDLIGRLEQRIGGNPDIDFVALFAMPFPGRVALKFLGFPEDAAPVLDELLNTIVDLRGTDAARAAAGSLHTYIEGFLESHRTRPLNCDVILSAIAHAKIDGARLSPAQQNSLTTLLLFGGFTTTTFALSCAMHWLASHPQDRQRLSGHPELLPLAVEEFVRFASPGTYLGRTVTRDTELRSTQLKKGTRVLLSYGSANRDESVFARADEIMLDRAPNRHLGFGYANHSCLGVHLARLELRLALQLLLSHLGDFEVDRSREIRWSSGETQGMTTLPLTVRMKN
jgi:cytochrome P450